MDTFQWKVCWLGTLICRGLAGGKLHRRTCWHHPATLKPVKVKQVRPSDALFLHRTQIREIALSHRVSSVRVFGSALHGDDTADSDLDLLVEPLPEATLFDLGGMQDELQELLGVSVDVLTLKDLPVKFRDSVFQEARPV